MLDQIMEVLTPRRMMSVGNLAASLEMDPAALQVRLDQLEAGGRIRYALSRCSGSCSSCAGCGDSDEPAEPVVDETAIVISLELRAEED
ncbi:hypothetical protein EGM51_14370 [Verrucomicrobia bacterium S94]|nr:hypothetical protein EGM51_14370 [Verrucomicrobia bacterium S94]